MQKGKQGTKGAKQIVEENVSTLKFYQYMGAGATTVYFLVVFVLFEFNKLTLVCGLLNCLNGSNHYFIIFAYRLWDF